MGVVLNGKFLHEFLFETKFGRDCTKQEHWVSSRKSALYGHDAVFTEANGKKKTSLWQPTIKVPHTEIQNVPAVVNAIWGMT